MLISTSTLLKKGHLGDTETRYWWWSLAMLLSGATPQCCKASCGPQEADLHSGTQCLTQASFPLAAVRFGHEEAEGDQWVERKGY